MKMNNTIQNNYTIEDIHNIRCENYEKTKNMSHQEIIEHTKKDASYGLEFLRKLRIHKDMTQNSHKIEALQHD